MSNYYLWFGDIKHTINTFFSLSLFSLKETLRTCIFNIIYVSTLFLYTYSSSPFFPISEAVFSELGFDCYEWTTWLLWSLKSPDQKRLRYREIVTITRGSNKTMNGLEGSSISLRLNRIKQGKKHKWSERVHMIEKSLNSVRSLLGTCP